MTAGSPGARSRDATALQWDANMPTQQAPAAASWIIAPLLGIILGVVIVLVANFVLDGLADNNDAWHNIQHGTFVVGGVLIGIGATLLWVSGRRA